MKGIIAALLAMTCAVGVFVYFLALEPVASEPPAPTVTDGDLEGLGQSVSRLEDRLDALEQSLAGLTAALEREAPSGVEEPRRSVVEEMVSEAMADWVATHGDPTAAGTAGLPAAGSNELTAEDAFMQLSDQAPLRGGSSEKLWEEVRDAGLLDAVVGMFQKRATEAGSAEAYVELGEAFLQKVFEAGNGPEAGRWAIKADVAFDEALAVDDHHWAARFNKAINLSFWPPMFGKQPEAIRNFEILVEQQRSLPPSEEHAQTFLILGNLHSQSGDQEKAATIWKQGAEQFPDNAALGERLAGGEDR